MDFKNLDKEELITLLQSVTKNIELLQKSRIAKRNILSDGLPPIEDRPSGSNSISNHLRAKTFSSHFETLENIKYKESDFGSGIYGVLKSRKALIWSSESMIQTYVGLVLNDLIEILGLSNQIVYLEEIGIDGIRPDWRVLKIAGRPIGLIEVKRPSETILNEEHVVGQIFDYIHMIKVYFGLPYMFAILSTYKHWRIFWDTEGLEAVSSKTVDKPPNITDEFEELPISHHSDKFDYDEPDSPSVQLTRNLFASKIYNYNDSSLINILSSVIIKMVHTPREPVPKC